MAKLSLGKNLSMDGKLLSHKEANKLPIRGRSPNNIRIWITTKVYSPVSTGNDGEEREGLGKYTGPELTVLERHPFWR